MYRNVNTTGNPVSGCLRVCSLLAIVFVCVTFSSAQAQCEPVLTVPLYDTQTWVSGCDVQVNGVVSPAPGCPAIAQVEWDWGDGTGNDHWFPAPHTYEWNGEYTVTVTPFDADGGSAPAQFTLSVVDCAAPPEIWTTEGPYGGSVHDITSDPVEPSTVYAATGNGIFKSEDGGDLWHKAKGSGSNTLPDTTISRVALGRDGRLYAGISYGTDEIADLSQAAASHDGSNPMFGLFPGGLFDGDTSTLGLVNFADEPVGIVFEFDEPVTARGARAFWTHALGGGDEPDYDWSFACADTLADLQSQTGSYRLLSSGVTSLSDMWSEIWFTPVTCSVFEFVGDRLTGDHYLHVNELEIIVGPVSHGVFWSEDGGDSWFPGTAGMENAASIRDLVVNPTPPYATVFASTELGIYRSDDGGQNWVSANGTPPDVLPYGSGNVLAIVGTTLFSADRYGAYNIGVWRSTDAGASWFPANGVAPNELPHWDVSVIAPGAAGRLYVGLRANYGLYWTDDSGETWNVANGIPPNTLPLPDLDYNWMQSLVVDGAGDLYLGGTDGIFKGTGGGDAWSRLTLPVTPLQVTAFATDPSSSDRVFAASDGGVFRSEDAGMGWTARNAGLGAFWTFEIVSDPGAPDSLFAVGTGIAISTDGGVSWTDHSQSLHDRYMWDLAIFPSQSPEYTHILFALDESPEGLARRGEGDPAWSYPTADPEFFGPYGPWLTALDVDPTNSDLVYVGERGYPNRTGTDLPHGSVFRSQDGGVSWEHLFTPPSPPGDDPDAIVRVQPSSLRIDPNSPQRIYVANMLTAPDSTRGWHLVRSADGGATWDEGLLQYGSRGWPLITFDTNDPSEDGTASVAYVYMQEAPGDAFRSRDGGATWEQLPTLPAILYGLSSDPNAGGTLYGLFSDATVRISRDRGGSWQALPMNGFDDRIRWNGGSGGIAVVQSTPPTIHAGTLGGVYSYVTLGEQTHQPEDATLPGSHPTTLTFDNVVASGTSSVTSTVDAPTLPPDVLPGDPTQFYDLTTDAIYAGNVEVCVDYNPADYNWPAQELMLYRYDEQTEAWQDVTTYVDTDNWQICGVVSELSFFAIVEPRQLPDIGVPIRWCGVAGAPSIDDPSVVGEATANDVLLSRQTIATDSIFLPQAGLIFRSGTTASAPTFPILTDPDTTIGATGDVFVDPAADDFDEFLELIQACRDAWVAADPSVTGITAVSINRFVDAAGDPINLFGLGGRADAGDCAEQMVAGRIMVVDGSYRPTDTIEKILGHELGHGLSLMHGDGIDNDANGILDDESDPLDGFNLMQYQETGSLLTSPQGSQMRDQALECVPDVTVAGALQTSGSQGSDPLADAGTPGWVDLIDIGLYRSTDSTDFFSSTAAPLPPDGEGDFWMLVDLDDDPITGGEPPAIIGSPVGSLRGIEMVTSTTVTVTSGVPTTDTTVWVWDGQDFVVQNDPGIRSKVKSTKVGLFQDLSGQIVQAADPAIGETVVVSIPNTLLPPMALTPTLTAVAIDPATGATDVAFVELDLTPPVFPETTVTPGTAAPGESIVVDGSGLPADSPVEVYLGDVLIATGTTDGNGDVSIPATIPVGSAGGERLITIGVVGPDVAVTGTGTVIVPTSPSFDIPPTPSPGTELAVMPGDLIELTIVASDIDSNDVVSLSTIDLPLGATFNPTAGNPASGTFSWTPTVSQGGTHGVTFSALDQGGSAAPPLTLSIVLPSNQPPVAVCQDVTIPTDPGVCSAALASIDAGSWDPDGDPLTHAQSPSEPYGLGTTTVTLTVADDSGENDTCTATVTVVDTEAPIVTPPAALTPECNTTGGVAAGDLDIQAWLASATAVDNCTMVALVDTAPYFFPIGTTEVTFSATDESGNSGGAASTVAVIDTVPPQFTALTSTPDHLWPPNHKMQDVHFAVAVTDVCDPDPLISLDSVVSSEPEDAPGNRDGVTDNDIDGAETGTNDYDIRLRAERAGDGPGRAYATTYLATDASGNTGTASTLTYVPHDRGGVVEPVMIEVSGGRATSVTWDEVPGAIAFDAVRGNLAAMRAIDSTTYLGPVACVDTESADMTTPEPGGVFIYLVQARFTTSQTSFGTANAVKPRVVEGDVDCN